MENKKQTLGAGIITLSLFNLIPSIILIAMLTFVIVAGNGNLEEFDMSALPQLILYFLSIASIILILAKRKIGVYLFFATWVLITVYMGIIEGFAFSDIAGILMTALYGYFIYKRWHVFK